VKVMTLHFYIMITMMYGICVVVPVIFSVCHYFLFFVTAMSITILLL